MSGHVCLCLNEWVNECLRACLLLLLLKGGTKACDHWHQGAGFVTSHIGLTLMYEMSLQAINPAVSVPYWDFTLESTFFGASDFRTSGVFADDWFGAASPDNVRDRSVDRWMDR